MMIMSCKKAAKIASDSLERRLTFRERVGLVMHTWMCRACTLYTKQLRTIKQVARKYADEEARASISSEKPLPPEAKERIKHGLHERLERPDVDPGGDGGAGNDGAST